MGSFWKSLGKIAIGVGDSFTSGLVSTGINAIGGLISSDRQQSNQRDLAHLQFDQQKELNAMNNAQYQQNVGLNPVLQANGMRAAGLNPSSVTASGAPMQSGSTGQGSGAPLNIDPLYSMVQFSQMKNVNADTKVKEAQAENTDAQTRLADSQARYTDAMRMSQEWMNSPEYRNSVLRTMDADATAKLAAAGLSAEQCKQVAQNIKNLKQQFKLTKAETKQIQQKTANLIEELYQIREQTLKLQNENKMFPFMQRLMSAQTVQAFSVASLNAALKKSEDMLRSPRRDQLLLGNFGTLVEDKFQFDTFSKRKEILENDAEMKQVELKMAKFLRDVQLEYGVSLYACVDMIHKILPVVATVMK